ncbi:D-alanyl-D-alanine carboxypeptidase/D-alanyl-D-alanine-endopeptidase [Curvibacter sp. APW13]|nr:D-alanyl-D-alanine carboxypeptidase/D-alanyl-D-alanine-endopeptidase [Curvibacter sp. APW13]MDT8990080.1 D-alanyl-D-alanine carboxypeptidase/D-alanyl-D-alanine-endopeptidase [Curvibacter sp. APW13]
MAAGLVWTALVVGAQPLPAEVQAALARAKVPPESVAMLVTEVQGNGNARLAHRAGIPMNPASVMKLVTTSAALDLLGPTYQWKTPVYLEGPVRDGVLQGNLVIKGQGDPKLVLERIWLLLRRVQGLGIQTVAGDIVLDRSAFEVAPVDPSQFDGEPLRPYNATPDALLLNYKALVMTFTPDLETGVARVQYDPPLAGVQLPATVPLLRNGDKGNDCSDYRASLKADFADPTRIRFGGAYPASCGERTWPVAYADPASYSLRAVQGLWQYMGGKLQGIVRFGTLGNPAAKPAFEAGSEPLALIVRDINKYSNNVMAQQLFLTLGRAASDAAPESEGVALQGSASFARSQQAVGQWWQSRLPGVAAPELENGSGLSRRERISAHALARLLQLGFASPWMPELMASLPISGVDGTLKRMKNRAQGSAHLKTGSLRDVTALGGFVLGASGKRYVLVALVNHPNAIAARPALEALVEWAARDQ